MRINNLGEGIRKISYKKIFFIDEIESSKIMQILFYAISLSFFVTFYGWDNSNSISISSFIKGFNICPPYFQNCGNYYFLEGLPYGYTQGFFYVILFLILSYGILSAIKHNWETAHKAIFVGFFWKIIFVFFLTYGIGGNYDYYDICLAFVFLFLPKKEYFSKLLFVTFYFAASTIKIHEGWILANYLNTTYLGAPFFNEKYLPIFTNIVIIMQIIGGWFLLSKNKTLQMLSFIYFFLFHVYSGIIVNYRYITISLTTLVILFGHNFETLKISSPSFPDILPITKKTILGYIFILMLLLCQSIAIIIPGDQKKTLEGNFYGLYMFEANHQCISTATIYYKNNTTKESVKTNSIANNRCDPYAYWYRLKGQCVKDGMIAKISWTFDHSINGHQFQRIVDENNACTLEYKNLQHNEWIKIGENIQEINKPVYRNGYSKDLYSESKKNQATPFESKFLFTLEKIYWSLWMLALVFVVSKLIIVTYKSRKLF